MARIAFVLPGYPRRPGGGHKVVYQYANELARRGHQVLVTHMRPANPEDEQRSRRGLLVLRLQYVFGRRLRPRWFALDKRVIVVNSFVQDESRIVEVDALVATSVRTADFVARVATSREIVGAYFIQHYEDFSDPAEEVNRTWQLPLQRIVVADWLAARAERLGLSASVVANALDLSEFPEGPPIAQRPLMLLGLASELPWKRTDMLLEVMARVNLELPNVELHAFGTGSKPAGWPEYITFHANPTPLALRSLYQRATAYLCTSDSEGFGLPAAEAMASGAAVVSTRNGGVESFAHDAAVFVAPGDADAMTTETLALLRDPDLTKSWAERGTSHVRARSVADAAREFEQSLLLSPPRSDESR